MRYTILILLACSAVLLTAFWTGAKSTLDPRAYVRWIEDPANGLRLVRKSHDVQFELQYRPADYIIAQENAKPVLDEKFHTDRQAQLGDMMYFTLAIQSGSTDIMMHNMKDESEYYQRANYYALDFQQDIRMVIEKDTLPCSMYQFENTYGVTPYIKMLLAFSGSHRSKLETSNPVILVNDRVFGGGLMRFEYQHTQLNAVPKIQLH